MVSALILVPPLPSQRLEVSKIVDRGGSEDFTAGNTADGGEADDARIIDALLRVFLAITDKTTRIMHLKIGENGAVSPQRILDASLLHKYLSDASSLELAQCQMSSLNPGRSAAS